MQAFSESRFRAQVDKALEKTKTILENTRAPKFPADVPHQYSDKFLLAEYLTNTSLASLLNCLEALGLGEKKLQVLLKWSKTRSVTIRLKAEERCIYDREQTRKETSPVEYVREYSSVLGKTTVTDKTITTYIDHYWKYELQYELFAFQGNNPDEKITLQGRTANYEIVTVNTKTPPPKPQSTIQPSMDLNITWLLSNIADSTALKFSINRSDTKCRTPRRNPEVQAALSFYNSYYEWAIKVQNYFNNQIFTIQVNHGYDLSKVNDNGIFVPVVPLFEEQSPSRLALTNGPGETSSGGIVTVPATSTPDRPVMLIGDVNQFLAEQKRSLLERFSDLSKMFTDVKKLITIAEVNLVTASMHGQRVCQHYSDGVDYIEDMLYKQLVSAIGKEVSSLDFSNYMRFHNRQLFRKEYEPQLFSYAVRRPDHFPEGTVSIEEHPLDGSSIAEPIYTMVRSGPAVRPMKFSLNSSTQVTFFGERHIHGWVSHQFASQPSSQFFLVPRARQFSSYIVMLGRILTAELFEPKYAMIVQNKDEIKIPLVMETIPTPKEFRDAIESLSPEQQRFAKAYRSMQLSSTLFGVLIIQIKPQLEKLLKLPDDSLTKEIRLTQDLMELFIKYQIPSDLLSFSGPNTADKLTRVNAVKHHVKAMQDMINSSKAKELEEITQEHKFENISLSSSEDEMDSDLRDDLLLTKSIQLDSLMLSDEAGDRKMDEKKSVKRKKGGAAKPGSATKGKRAPVLGARGAKAKPFAPSPSSSPSSSSASSASGSSVGTAATNPQSSQQQTNQQSQQQSQQQQQPTVEEPEEEEEVEDYTKIPGELDRKFEELDEDSALRPTIIQIGNTWTKRSQKALLAPPQDQSMSETEQEAARNQAFDLLDSLSRSGALSVDHASLHVIMASTHCFTKNLMNTVIQDNVNPIEKMERSVLIVGTTVQSKSAQELVKEDQLDKVSTYSPKLFLQESL